MYPRMHFLFFFKTLLSCMGPALRLTLADPCYIGGSDGTRAEADGLPTGAENLKGKERLQWKK